MHHYTYNITNKITNKHYIGVRSSKCNPEIDLGTKYFGSSKVNEITKNDQLKSIYNYTYSIISMYDSRNDANNAEEQLHKKYNVAFNDNYYNLKNANGKWNTYGKVTVKDILGNTKQVDKTDPQYVSGDLFFIAYGKVTVRDSYGNTMQVDKNNANYLNGNLVHIFTGYAVVKDKHGNKLHASLNDPDYLNGNLVGHTKGYGVFKDADNNTMMLSLDDSKVKNKDVVGILAGKIIVKDEHGNKFAVDKNDPDYLNGNLVGHTKGYKASDKTKQLMSSQRTGKLNSSAQPISIHNVKFDTIKDASNILGITNRVISIRCKSNKEQWKEWIYLEKKSAI